MWIDASADRIAFVVREASSLPAGHPAPIEFPIEYIAGGHTCPHCGVVPERFRKLSGGSLVCLACGRSS
jgi:hypothetical protein